MGSFGLFLYQNTLCSVWVKIYGKNEINQWVTGPVDYGRYGKGTVGMIDSCGHASCL